MKAKVTVKKENVIEINELIKEYSSFKLGEINLNIPNGSIIGLIGENGAGKTTLIKSILNIIKINKGSIRIFGKDSNKYESLIKEDIGVVLDNVFFPELLTPKDISTCMKNIFLKWDNDLFNKYINDFGLSLNQKIKEMSKGMRKKLEIATALSHHPKLLILDEPTSGLDPVVRNEILDIFLEFIENDENTILFSTHITSDLEHIADEIIFIDKGKVIIEENKKELLNTYGILKTNEKKFKEIKKEDIISYKKVKEIYEILVKNKTKISKKYNCKLDKITLEELMVLMIKGEK